MVVDCNVKNIFPVNVSILKTDRKDERQKNKKDERQKGRGQRVEGGKKVLEQKKTPIVKDQVFACDYHEYTF